MKNKKVRGQKRKLNNLLRNIDGITPSFSFIGECEHFHVPCGWWISEPKTSSKIETEFCKKWIEKARKIIDSKPQDQRFCKVVANIATPYFGSSQIIIFYDEHYYNTFFDRKGDYQVWIPVENYSFVGSRGIDTDLNEKGYLEILHEDDYTSKCEIWFYGEI